MSSMSLLGDLPEDDPVVRQAQYVATILQGLRNVALNARRTFRVDPSPAMIERTETALRHLDKSVRELEAAYALLGIPWPEPPETEADAG
jgi:hypothetical protein